MAKTDYTIGEVADLLHISKDMIRYYEKQGNIVSRRNAANNYRTYDATAVFWLLEAIQHKNLGLNIRDIESLRSSHYDARMAEHLENYSELLAAELSYKSVLKRRIQELEKRYAISDRNVGNYWTAAIPGSFRCHLVDGTGDCYGRISMSERASGLIFSDRLNPFVESGFTAKGDVQSWEMYIEESWKEELGAELPEEFAYAPGRICYCTHVDIGEMGKADPAVIPAFKATAMERYGKAVEQEEVRGLIISRGAGRNGFHRIIELQIPIE